MKGLMLMLFSCALFAVNAQEAKSKNLRPKFFSTNQLIHLEGSAGSAFAVQSVNGLQLKGWGLGIGAGLDRYRMRSFPIFLHLRRQVPFAKVPLFMYADAGRNFVWARTNETIWNNFYEMNHGFYFDGGLQYHLTLRNNTALVFSAGYGEKTYSEIVTNRNIWCVTGACPELKNQYDHRFRRIVLKAGFHF